MPPLPPPPSPPEDVIAPIITLIGPLEAELNLIPQCGVFDVSSGGVVMMVVVVVVFRFYCEIMTVALSRRL